MNVTYPGAKKTLVDKYAQIALFDAAQNQKAIEDQMRVERERKMATRKALDEQIRMKQAAIAKERLQDGAWSVQEAERLKVWKTEEEKKIAENKAKEAVIREQRMRQLQERQAIAQREKLIEDAREQEILHGIHKDMVMERAREMEKRRRDEEAAKKVKLQNEQHLILMRQERIADAKKLAELDAIRLAMAEKEELERENALKKTYARQARQYAASASMQEEMNRLAREDEARAQARMKADAERADALERSRKEKREMMKRDALDVLAIQVREKLCRAQAEAQHEELVGTRSKEQVTHAEQADARRKLAVKNRNLAYSKELKDQIKLQRDRKCLEPFLMSKAEREMNAAMLSQLP